MTQSGHPNLASIFVNFFALRPIFLCLASHINVAFADKLSGDGLNAYDDAATIATKRWIEEKY
jgi:hypothetical protein